MLVVFEGLDGCGKTTQIQLVHSSLLQQKHDTILLQEPGSTYPGEQIRQVLKTYKLNQKTRALLFCSARHFMLNQLNTALSQNKLVLCDRYIYSTYAYQFKYTSMIDQIHSIIQPPTPDLVFFFQHKYRHNTEDLLENTNQQLLLKRYLQLSKSNWIFVPNLDIPQITKFILNTIYLKYIKPCSTLDFTT